MESKYKLLRDCETPGMTFRKGCIATKTKWIEYFPSLASTDMCYRQEWFELIENKTIESYHEDGMHKDSFSFRITGVQNSIYITKVKLAQILLNEGNEVII